MKSSASSQGLTDLIGKAYDAALDQRLWQPFLESLARTCHAHQALFLRREGRPCVKESLDTVNLDLNVIVEWDSCKEHIDVWLQNIGRIAQGEPYSSTDVIPNRMLRKSGFYADILRPLNIDYSLGGIVENQPDRHSFLAIYRKKELGAFESQSRTLLRMLIPHVHRALLIHRKLASAEETRLAYEQTLDRLHHGVAICDIQGRVIFVNHVAETIFRAHDGLSLTHNRVKAANDLDNAQLQRILAQTIAISTGAALTAAGVAVAHRPSGKRPYQILLSPLNGCSKNQHTMSQAAGVVFICDSDEVRRPSAELLAVVFGLTQAEVRVCQALAGSLTTSEIAAALGVSANTVKTHLKQIFRKVGTSSKAKLLQVLALHLD